MKHLAVALAIGAATLTAGCATGPRSGPVDVLRYHTITAPERGSFSVEPLSTNATISPEYQSYAAAVSRELQELGFTPAPATASQYVASVAFNRGPRGVVDRPSPVSIGLGGGGGSFGRRSGIGLGGGIGFGLGGGQREVIGTELAVQIRRRSDNTVIWDGRATTSNLARTAEAQPLPVADRLADALFRGFPGESGISTTVP